MSGFDDKLDEDDNLEAPEITAEPFADCQPELVSTFLVYGEVKPGATVVTDFHQLQCMYRHLFGHRAELDTEVIVPRMSDGHRMVLVISHSYHENISLSMEQAVATKGKDGEFSPDGPDNCLELQINLLTSIEIERNEHKEELGLPIPRVGEYLITIDAEEEDDAISVLPMGQEVDPDIAQRVVLLALPLGIETSRVWIVPPGQLEADGEMEPHAAELLVPPADAPEEWLQYRDNPADVQVAYDLGSAFLDKPAPVGFTRVTSLPEMINAYQNLLGDDFYPNLDAADDWLGGNGHIIIAITDAYPENYYMNMAAIGTIGSAPLPPPGGVINLDCVSIELNLTHQDNEEGGARADETTDEPRQVLFIIGIYKDTREVSVTTLPPHLNSGPDEKGDELTPHSAKAVCPPQVTPRDWQPGMPHRRVSVLH